MRKRSHRRIRPTGHVLTPDQVRQMVTPIHIALKLLPLGLYTEQHAHDLAAFLSVAQVAAEDARRDDIVKAGADGARVLLAMRDRVRAGRAWNVTADERDKLTRCVVVIDRWFRTQTSARWIRAMRKVYAMSARAWEQGLGELDLISEAA